MIMLAITQSDKICFKICYTIFIIVISVYVLGRYIEELDFSEPQIFIA